MSILQECLTSLSNHHLEIIQEGIVSAYYLRPPEGGRNMSTLIVFSPEGIAIVGDFTPQTHGSVSALGYGVEWFSTEKSGSYLCCKFLQKKWVPEFAVAELQLLAGLSADEGGIDSSNQEALREIIEALKSGEHGAEWLYEELTELQADFFDELPGMGYEPNESARLLAIQSTFSRLYLTNPVAPIKTEG